MTVVGPAPDTLSRRERMRAPVLAAAGIGLATVALRLHDPHQPGSWGLCPTRLLTGLDCPGCGGLRAVNDLTHGDLAAAAASNLLLVASIPLAVALWAWWAWARWAPDGRPAPRISSRTVRGLVAGYAVVAAAFTIYRNTPWGHGLWA